MRGFARSLLSFSSCVSLLLCQNLVLISQLITSFGVDGTKFDFAGGTSEMAELQRSRARYHDLLAADNSNPAFMRNLLQVEDQVKSKEAKRDGQSNAQNATRNATDFDFPEPYLLGPRIKDWDEQRANWLAANPRMKSMPDGKPRVLITTGSQPSPCHSPVGDNFHIRSFKLKIDYARMHKYEIYYNFAWMDPLFGTYWVKLPLIRKLMLTHPEIEWFIWVDSDAVFTDMLFEPPFHSYDREGHNMVMWSWKKGFHEYKSWVSVNAGVFIIRNCQWSLDLIDKWSPMGPAGPVRVEYGKILSSYLPDRYDNYPADDQSALIYLMLTDDAVMSKIKLVESEYLISGWWVGLVNKFERAMENYHPGLGDNRWPWITHFTGCSPCSGGNNKQASTYEVCMNNFTRAYSFADNQVLAYLGYQHESLASPAVIRIKEESHSPLQFLGINPWAERIAAVAAARKSS